MKLEGCALAGGGARARACGRGEARAWLRGYGWRDGDWRPSVAPTKEALDEVTGGTPTILISKDYHSLWLNSAALAAADGELAVAGGVVERDARGEPTGVLREESAWRFRDRHVETSEDEWVEATRAGLRLAASRGVGAIHDKDGWLGAPGIFQRLRDEGALNLRVWGRSRTGSSSMPRSSRCAPGSATTTSRRLSQVLHGRHARLADRAPDWTAAASGSRAARSSRTSSAAARRRAGRSPCTRSATREPRGARRVRGDAHVWQPLGLRQRVEHAQCLDPVDLPRFAQLGVACSVQFSHAPSDRDLAERFWPGRLEGAYAFRSLVESGALVANGSDAPVEELDPLAGIAAGVLRTIDERPAWRPEQAVTLEQALHAQIVAPAWLSGDERRRGRLLPGLLADLVVLDRDPFGVEPEELRELQVVATMVGGRWTHNPPGIAFLAFGA